MSNETEKKEITSFNKFYKVLLIVTSVLALLSFIMSSTILVGVISIINSNPAARQNNFLISKKYDKGQTIQKALKSDKPAVVFFYVDWCGYCKRFAPQFNKVTKTRAYKKIFATAYVNCDDLANQDFVKEYDVKGFPTVFLVDKAGKKTQISVNSFYDKDPIKLLKSVK